ncbi:DUF1627 domain-containing protein [Salmonella enterica]|nr:DUF1627 domain-containing protein [Salmonella enterica]EGL7478652.1 DUF1627 domain-containing protein [Salmonella enterica]EIZ2336008.1 DUF1627 domain-containing protein [Salmonella enterica]
MRNETVNDVLKAMGKATAREIAARLGIDMRDALDMLREQHELEAVEFCEGYWLLSGDTSPVKLAVEPESVAKVVQSIPSFAEKRPDDVMIPAPRFISAEIRRTAAKLKRLQALREVAREVHKPRNRKLWQQVSRGMD